MEQEFAGKIAVVAGGSRGIGRGIGRAIAGALAREGAAVALVSSSEANLAAAAASISESGPARPFTRAADRRLPEDCQRVFDSVGERFGHRLPGPR